MLRSWSVLLTLFCYTIFIWQLTPNNWKESMSARVLRSKILTRVNNGRIYFSNATLRNFQYRLEPSHAKQLHCRILIINIPQCNFRGEMAFSAQLEKLFFIQVLILRKQKWGTSLSQWGENLPSTDAARIRFWRRRCVIWVRSFFTLCWFDFLGHLSYFPLLLKSNLIWFVVEQLCSSKSTKA